MQLGQGQRSLGSKVRVKQMEGHSDGRTEATALPPVLTRPSTEGLKRIRWPRPVLLPYAAA